MSRLGSNLSLVALIVVTAIVIIQIARHGDRGATPKAAIESADDEKAGNSRDAAPRVIQPKATIQDSAAMSPLRATESPAFGEANRISEFPVSPLPYPSEAASVDESVADEAATTPTYGGTFPIATPFTPDDDPPAEADAPLDPNTPADEAAPAPAASRIVTGPADSFWSLSEKAYGSGIYYRALFRHNRKEVLRPDQLKAGIEIEVPSLEMLRKLYPQDFPMELPK